MNQKFCPRCGTANLLNAAYCIKCGYAFKTAKQNRFKTILFIIILLIVGWILLRNFTNQPIIPEGIINLFTNSTSNATR